MLVFRGVSYVMKIYAIPPISVCFLGMVFYGIPYISEKHLGWVEILFHLAREREIYYIYTHMIFRYLHTSTWWLIGGDRVVWTVWDPGIQKRDYVT